MLRMFRRWRVCVSPQPVSLGVAIVCIEPKQTPVVQVNRAFQSVWKGTSLHRALVKRALKAAVNRWVKQTRHTPCACGCHVRSEPVPVTAPEATAEPLIQTDIVSVVSAEKPVLRNRPRKQRPKPEHPLTLGDVPRLRVSHSTTLTPTKSLKSPFSTPQVTVSGEVRVKTHMPARFVNGSTQSNTCAVPAHRWRVSMKP